MSKGKRSNRNAVAIIGMACIFPKAPNLEAFWCNILDSVDAIDEPLPDWEAGRYLESKRINSSSGGYLKDLYRFNPQEFGIMPNSVDGGEPDHFLALRVARDALLDSGYSANGHDHRDTGIILGHSTYLHRGQGNLIQHHIVLDQSLELLKAIFPDLGSTRAAEVKKILKSKLPRYCADIAPGLVPNVMAGLIANRLNLNGPNYLVDAACSSSLLAVNAAMDELRNGRSRMMLTGGVNASLPAEVSTIFTDLGALSRKGQIRPFDAESDGTLLGEGLGIVVLKMERDAISDGDRIYAVIHGIGKASDGKGHGLLAPSAEGEALAIARAYAETGIDPMTIDLVEAHGTGIQLGDKTEIAALKKIFGERKGTFGRVAIGSVKSMISHCIPAAGIAGLIKTALAIHHKVLPPTLCNRVNPDLGIEQTPFYVNTVPRPWFISPGTPRRAGINSFGFGGINTHAILEEAPQKAARPASLSNRPAELCVFSAPSHEELAQKLASTLSLLGECPECRIGEVAAALLGEGVEGRYRLGIVAKNREDLRRKIKQAHHRIDNKPDQPWAMRSGIAYSCSPIVGKIAFMFPGEGSQYLEMFSDLALYFDEVRTWFDFWHGLYKESSGETRTDIVFPPRSELSNQQQDALEARLHDMDVGSEAAFIGGQAMHALLTHIGVKADVMVGHSTGESSALAASESIEYGDRSQLAEIILKLNEVYRNELDAGNIPVGSLLAVGALSREIVEKLSREVDKDIVIAMENCPNQLVIFGSRESIEKVQKILGEVGGICRLLPFDRGYHTPLFSAVSEAFLNYYEKIQLKVPAVPLYSCSTAGLFPGDVATIRKTAASQWSTEVRFAQTVAAMHRDGVRYFIEVGPSGNLCTFVNDILSGQEFLTLPTNIRLKNSIEQLLFVLAQLFVNNKEVHLDSLFASRSVESSTIQSLKTVKNEGVYLKNTMPIIHLESTDGVELRRLLLSPLKPPEAHISDGASSALNFVDGLPPGESAETRREAERQVMSDYLALMNDFLDRQNIFMTKISQRESESSLESMPEVTIAPLLHVVTELDDRHCIAECRFSVFEDNFLKNHILSGPVSEVDPCLLGLACVPLMVSLEILAEACALVAGNKAVAVIENIRTYGWIALDEDSISLNVVAEIIPADSPKYKASLFCKGKKVVTAEFSFAPQWTLSSLEPLARRRKLTWQDNELYTIGMFHGPLFQSISGIEGWDQSGIDARLSEVSLAGFLVENETPDLVLNPVLLDAVGQLAAYWIAQQEGTDFNCFPSTIERIELYQRCLGNIPGLTLAARRHPLDLRQRGTEHQMTWHFECLGGDGRALFRISNLTNVYYQVPHRFYTFRRNPLNGRLGKRNLTFRNDAVVLWELHHLPEAFCAQSEGIFLRILANAILGFEERALWFRLKGKKHRHKREWLLGRACIKEAVQWWVHRQTGKWLYPTDIIVLHDDLGAPYVDGWWNDSLVAAPEVSLSHDQRMSVAAVSQENAVGVDVEQIGRIRHPTTVIQSLNAREQLLLDGLDEEALGERLLRLLCSKEAAAKCLGLGLQGQPERYAVHFENGDWERCSVALDRAVANVEIHRAEDTLIALATGNVSILHDRRRYGFRFSSSNYRGDTDRDYHRFDTGLGFGSW